jgi:hypothetical protein
VLADADSTLTVRPVRVLRVAELSFASDSIGCFEVLVLNTPPQPLHRRNRNQRHERNKQRVFNHACAELTLTLMC